MHLFTGFKKERNVQHSSHYHYSDGRLQNIDASDNIDQFVVAAINPCLGK